ncbi:MAG: hypothetical protein BWY45_03402 [Euryarchaeota archaeon ADurb.Bin294]|nr:MAG: hypothetical protein BWY45_03402 [Euryarchaeota archaeon ADurb.Bin294]
MFQAAALLLDSFPIPGVFVNVMMFSEIVQYLYRIYPFLVQRLDHIIDS